VRVNDSVDGSASEGLGATWSSLDTLLKQEASLHLLNNDLSAILQKDVAARPAPQWVPPPQRPPVQAAPRPVPAARAVPAVSAYATEVEQFVNMGIDRAQAEAAMQRHRSFDAAFDALFSGD
jgi:hypothetical protein